MKKALHTKKALHANHAHPCEDMDRRRRPREA